LSGIVLAIILAAPTHAQLPFTLRDCLADRDENARMHICSIMSGTDEERALGAVEASRILRGRGEYDAAVDLLNSKGSSALLDTELGHVWFDQGDHMMADFHFEMALGRGYEPDALTRERMVIAAHMYGEELQYSSENVPGAVDTYARALALDPDHAPALLGQAEALQKLNRHDEALVGLDRAITLGADWTGYLLRGRSRRALGDMPGAIADFEQVLEENPEHFGARQALAELAAQP
jgi:tetratricopeptide (TPR) repeat protein